MAGPLNRQVQLTAGTVWIAVSLAAVVVGSLGPWVTVGPFSVSGTAGDGLIALGAGIVAALAVLIPRIPAFAAFAAAAVATAVAVHDLAAIVAADETFLGAVAPGWGVVLVALGGSSAAAWALLREAARPPWLLSLISVASVLAVAGAGVAGAVSGAADTPEETDSARSTGEAESETTTGEEARPEPAATPQVADVGEPLVLQGADGLRVRVTVREVRDPLPAGEYDSAPDGRRMVGVELELRNESTSETYDDSPGNGAKLIHGDDRQADATVSFGDCEAQSVTVAPGDSRRVCVPFEVTADSTLRKFQLALDSGFSDHVGEWVITETTPSPTRAPQEAEAGRDDAGRPPESALTSCDQNIRAGPATTCGFADAVFIEYARLLQEGETEMTVELRATSPANNRRYSVTCEVADDEDVHCRAGDGAYVRFPLWAAEVY